MAIQKFLNLEGLSVFLDNLRSTFSPSKHTHTKSEITDLTVDSSLSATSTNPVQNSTVTAALDAKVPTTRTINGKSLSSNISLSPADVGADPTGTASSAVATHNTTTDAHNDIRLLVSELSTQLNNFLNVDDTTKDQLSEVIAMIEANEGTIESLASGKVNVTDIINNLTTNVSDKPLSAAQGVALKALIDELRAALETVHVQANLSVNDERDPAYVKGRTHYISDPVETVLLEETSIETTGEDGASAFVSDSIKLVEGYTYLVTFNGTEYECVAYCYDDWDIVIIGNGSLVDAEGGNGEPFACIFMEGDGSDLITQEAGTYTLKIVEVISEVVKLPTEYLINSNVRNGEGSGSVVEGKKSLASGRYSHAEGYNTVSSGITSHAEGYATTASGYPSHAEGGYTNASGDFSHAEGSYTTASGTYSHSEGYRTTVSNYGSHAEGAYTIVQGHSAHAEGYYTTASGDGSHAEGFQTTASGHISHAEGQSTYAIDNCSHAEGRYTVAFGDCSHAEGYGKHESIALTGDAGSISYTVSSSYVPAIAIGDFIALGDAWSIVIGYDSSTKTITLKSTLNANSAVNKQFAELYSGGITSGHYSHSEGYQTVASGTYGAHAEGNESTASGMQSHAEGAYTIAQGNTSHAEGWQTKAYGDACHVEGSKTVAHGSDSHAEGEGTIASANAHAQHVQGRYNLQDTDKKYAHIVGNGTEDARSNAHTIDWDGNAWFAGKVYVGGTGQDDENATEVATLANSEEWVFTLEDGSTVTKKVVLG